MADPPPRTRSTLDDRILNDSLPNGATVTTEISRNAINAVADYAVQIRDSVDASMAQRVVESNFAPRIGTVPRITRASAACTGEDAVWAQHGIIGIAP